MEIRNIAVIAHVDHGKTTLVDRMIESGEYDSSQKQMTGDLIMDNNDLEKERGITIVSKNVSVQYKKTKINMFYHRLSYLKVVHLFQPLKNYCNKLQQI